MNALQSLGQHLEYWSGDDRGRAAIAETVARLAEASTRVSDLVAQGPLAGALQAVVGGNVAGDEQKELDLRANALFIDALKGAPVAAFGSEESEAILILQDGAPLAVAIDPLDGSSNIDTNLSIGTIFSILPMAGAEEGPAEVVFRQTGRNQLAAGFVVYGPQTALVLTLGQGTHIFTLDRESGNFLLTSAKVQIPKGKREYAINASNYRHWEEPVQAYIDDCISGAEGPRGKNFNMRWTASLVAEAFRILVRGGIFLYPRDNRPGYRHGRLRLVYEANPIAFVIEQAGGAATDGERRILDLVPTDLHQRVPLVFGSRDKVEHVIRYHTDRHSIGERSPLFGRRSLFRS
jgi:fructose-1,6-bisphosphatase I